MCAHWEHMSKIVHPIEEICVQGTPLILNSEMTFIKEPFSLNQFIFKCVVTVGYLDQRMV